MSRPRSTVVELHSSDGLAGWVKASHQHENGRYRKLWTGRVFGVLVEVPHLRDVIAFANEQCLTVKRVAN
jgi:hypothetical protein